MYVLNYFYFLILTFLAYYYLGKKGGYVSDPWAPKSRVWFTGTELFLVLTFSTGVLALSAPAGLNLMAVRLFVLEILCLICLIVSRQRPVWNWVTVLYGIYLLWILCGIYYSPAPLYGVRVFSKYLYVFLIILMASSVVRSDAVVFKSMFWARTVALVSVLVMMTPYVNVIIPGVFWYPTALAIHYITITVFSLALFFHCGRRKKDLLLAVFFLMPCFIWVFRTSIMGAVMALMVFCFFRYKLKSLPFMFLFLLLFVISVFYLPSVKDKMFFNKGSASISHMERGQISMENINSNGRFAMWEWSLRKFYEPNPVTGSGSGNLQEVFYSLEHSFSTIRICHNDYVQILCDNGLIGLVLFGGSFIVLMGHSFVVYQNRSHSAAIRICALTAGAATAGTLLTMYTDNVINYSMATISYPCGLYGMMLGLIREERRKKHVL